MRWFAALALLPACLAVAELQSPPLISDAGSTAGGSAGGSAGGAAGSTAGGSAGGSAGSATAGGSAAGCSHGAPLDRALRVTAVDAGAPFGPTHYALTATGGALAWHASDGVHITPLDASDRRAGPDVTVSADGVLGLATAPGEYAVLIRRSPDQLLVVRVTESGTVIRESTLIAGGDHTVIGTEWFSDFAQTGRLVRSAGGYTAYSALHRRWPDNIGHQGDQLRHVMDDGSVQPEWTWGCSHSGDQRLLDGAAVCLSDCYPQKAIMFNHTQAVISNEPAGNCMGGYGGELGGLAAASDGGWWFDYASREGRASQDLALVRLSASGAVLDRTWLTADAGDAHLPRLGWLDGQLLVGWQVNGHTFAQRLGGALVELTQVDFDRETDWVSAPNGDLVWASGQAIYRLRACTP